MNIAAIRTAVADAYPRRGWRKKVLQMSDEQVFAIYKNMERNGRLYSRGIKRPDLQTMETKMSEGIRQKIDKYDRAVEKILQKKGT